MPASPFAESDVTASGAPSALSIERSCAVTAVAFSDRRREGVRLMSGEHASFGLNSARSVVYVPYPPPAGDWTLRSLTCGVALQCSPSKDRIAQYPLHELSPRELGALTIVEGDVALGWVARRWPGLLPELRRLLPGLEIVDSDLDGSEMLRRTDALARFATATCCPPAAWTASAVQTGQRRPYRSRQANVRQDAVDVAALRLRAPDVHTRRRRRWRPKSQAVAAKPARGRGHRDPP